MKKENEQQKKTVLLRMKRHFTFMLSVAVMFTSMPTGVAFAYTPGSDIDDEVVLDDSVEEGDTSDLDIDISHTISRKGDKATVTVSAAPSDAGIENGVTKVTKVEIYQNGRNKKGSRVDGDWQFTVKENGDYSFIIYYNSSDGEEMMEATPSEAKKEESSTAVDPQNPSAGGNGGGAGGGAPETDAPETEAPETESNTGNTDDKVDETQDSSADGEKDQTGNSGNSDGGSDQGTSIGGSGEQSGQSGAGAGEEGDDGKNDEAGNDNQDSSSSDHNSQGSTDSDNSTEGDGTGEAGSTDKSDSSDDDSFNGDSSSDSNSGSSDNSSSASSGDSGSSSDNSDSGNADSSGSDSSSGDNNSSADGSSSSEEPLALNVIDFFFPVIEAQAGDFTVKKAVIVEYEITNLFPEGDPKDVTVDIFDESTEEGAMITLLAEPSDIGLEKGVREITDVTLIDFEAEENSEIIGDKEIEIATDSEADEVITKTEDEVVEASPSEAIYDTSKSSSAKYAEYQASENEEGEYRFFVKENGTYTFLIRYSRLENPDYEDCTDVIETQFLITYDLDTILNEEIQFIGVEDTTIKEGENFDLLEGVYATGRSRQMLEVAVESDDGFDIHVPGNYKVMYAAIREESEIVAHHERTVTIATSNIEINEINFPDANFREYVKQFDLDSNGILEENELAAVTDIVLESYQSSGHVEYTSVEGIQYFFALKSFKADYPNFKSLDLSKNILLEKIDCGQTYLEEDLDVSKLINLKELTINNLGTCTGSINLSQNTKLEKLNWADPQTMSIDLSHNQELKEVTIRGDKVTEVNIKNNPNLTKVTIQCRYLEEIDLSGSPKLVHITCCGVKEGTGFGYEPYKLKSLILNPDAQLSYIYCNDTQLQELHVNSDRLMALDCSNASLNKLDLSPKTTPYPLTLFNVSGNRLPYLDLEDVRNIMDFRGTGQQEVSGYYTKSLESDAWYFDMKQLIGDKRTDRVDIINTDDIESYNRKSGILTLASLPVDGTVSYQYDIKADRKKSAKLNVTAKLKPVEMESESIIYVTAEQARDEEYLKKLIRVNGKYGLDDGTFADIEKNDFQYYFDKTDGVVTSVGISAVMDNKWETPVMTTTNVKILQKIEGNNVVLYEGESYEQDQLNVRITEGDVPLKVSIDDELVRTDKAGTYQVKVTADISNEVAIEKYLYVQVVGKTKIVEIPDLHVRKGTSLTGEQLVQNVKAVYEKPLDIPETPWPDAQKVNNGLPTEIIEVEPFTNEILDTGTVQKSSIRVTAPGMIPERELAGRSEEERFVYVHGTPVVVAYDNGLNTKQLTSATILEQVVRTGSGIYNRPAASAYVEYVQPDGSIKKVVIAPEEIVYAVGQFIPQTAGDYYVTTKINDASVLSEAQAPGLEYATGEKKVKVVVADRVYTVIFETGEHGVLANPSDAITSVEHGKKVTTPLLVPEEGYTLNYWADENGNRTDFDNIVITDNRKFTAEFKLKEFTVRFIGKNNRVIKTEIVKYGHDAIPPTDDKDVMDKRFNGWSASYRNIKSDMDIYTTYWTSSGGGGGGHNGGGSFVPSGPGTTMPSTEIPGGILPLKPDTIAILPDPVALEKGIDIENIMFLPKTGDMTKGKGSWMSYDVREKGENGSNQANGTEDPAGMQQVTAIADKGRKCILHIILFGAAILEGLYYWLRRRRDKKELKELEEKLNAADSDRGEES